MKSDCAGLQLAAACEGNSPGGRKTGDWVVVFHCGGTQEEVAALPKHFFSCASTPFDNAPHPAFTSGSDLLLPRSQTGKPQSSIKREEGGGEDELKWA